ncbi:decaprenyl-phosphate phosphoribosyltransferase [Paenibacillus caui]|uniref:decaprenyl-phosphate phosphoribosyltransferase n=1 Tax=Paenibacillus caui TaxID=2873927 RepID=UPI001CA9D323|nr:decaprenyl-phosphate phosphoribosyltransferase [Paenibacillus caui]
MPENPCGSRAYITAKCSFKEMRPNQWSKNLLVFSALLFSLQKITITNLFHLLIGFILFCFISGCVYIINDFYDREADQKHPIKKERPIASGMLNSTIALFFAFFLFFCSFVIALFLNASFLLILLCYFILNVAYSIKLKHVVIIDIMSIAAGFVIRAIAGGFVIITPWFLMCILLLSLFLAIGKRRHELFLLREGDTHRIVLKRYSIPLLDQLNSIVTTSTILCYSLFTFTSGRTQYLMLTIPFVIFGIFRYLYLIHIEQKGGAPDKILFEDKPILITVILYVITLVIIFSVFE